MPSWVICGRFNKFPSRFFCFKNCFLNHTTELCNQFLIQHILNIEIYLQKCALKTKKQKELEDVFSSSSFLFKCLEDNLLKTEMCSRAKLSKVFRGQINFRNQKLFLKIVKKKGLFHSLIFWLCKFTCFLPYFCLNTIFCIFHNMQVATIAWLEADSVCGSHSVAIPMVLVLPYIWRLLQCLRQYRDTKEKNCLFNGNCFW